MDCIHVGYLWIIVMFLLSVWTLILRPPIHYRGASDVMLNFYSNDETILDGLRVTKSAANFHLWVNYFLNKIPELASVFSTVVTIIEKLFLINTNRNSKFI